MSWKDTTIELLARRIDYLEESFANEREYLEDKLAALHA